MQADVNIKPEECVISSGYGPIKSEETDDEDKATDRSSSHENHLSPINIKDEALKVEVKTEDEASTDDERSPEYVVSSSGYDPVKSEETDDEDTNTSNEQHLPIKVKADVKTEDDSDLYDDDTDKEDDDPVSPQANDQNLPIKEAEVRKKKRSRSKRKREEVEESNRSSQKTARMECSVEGCTGKAADSGTCKYKHGGYDHCKHEGCTNQVINKGVCQRHGAVVKRKTCNYEGCTNQVIKGGVCHRHGAKRKICSHEGCTNNALKSGLCIRHGAKITRRTCKFQGCTNKVQCAGVCFRHGARNYQKKPPKSAQIVHIGNASASTAIVQHKNPAKNIANHGNQISQNNNVWIDGNGNVVNNNNGTVIPASQRNVASDGSAGSKKPSQNNVQSTR